MGHKLLVFNINYYTIITKSIISLHKITIMKEINGLVKIIICLHKNTQIPHKIATTYQGYPHKIYFGMEEIIKNEKGENYKEIPVNYIIYN